MPPIRAPPQVDVWDVLASLRWLKYVEVISESSLSFNTFVDYSRRLELFFIGKTADVAPQMWRPRIDVNVSCLAKGARHAGPRRKTQC
eukprot:s422_g14.t1